MPDDSVDQPKPAFARLRKIVPVLGVLLVVGIIYDGTVFYSRWNSGRQAEKTRAAEEVADDQKALNMIGGGGLKIISFYASPGIIHRGGHSSVCYGVTGAKTVRMEPALGETWPAVSHCLDASPRKDTEYKLVAEDGQGHSVTQSFVIQVR